MALGTTPPPYIQEFIDVLASAGIEARPEDISQGFAEMEGIIAFMGETRKRFHLVAGEEFITDTTTGKRHYLPDAGRSGSSSSRLM